MPLIVERRFIVKVSETYPTILSILDMDTDKLTELPLPESCAMILAQSLQHAYSVSPYRQRLVERRGEEDDDEG